MDSNKNKPTIRVAAAVIREGNKILAAQRGYGEFKDKWEFPGGKIEKGETPERALAREIGEELDAQIHIESTICSVSYDYPDFHLELTCFLCSKVGDRLVFFEHENHAWLDIDHLDSVDWLPADLQVIQAIKDQNILQ